MFALGALGRRGGAPLGRRRAVWAERDRETGDGTGDRGQVIGAASVAVEGSASAIGGCSGSLPVTAASESVYRSPFRDSRIRIRGIANL